MARIPLGNFGGSIAAPAPRVNVPAAAFDTGGQGLQQAGDAVMKFAAGAMEETRLQNEALQRAKAANSVMDREIAVKAVGTTLEQEIASGSVHYDNAPAEYKKRVGEIETPSLTGLDAVTAENLQRGLKRADFQGENGLHGAIQKARTADFRTQADGLLDKLGKQAGLPGADFEKIVTQARSIEDVGRQAYGAAWEKRLQDWEDNTRYARVDNEASRTRDSLDGINALQKRITEGDYAGKLDIKQKNAIEAKLDMYRTSYIQRAEAAASRAERASERHLKLAEAEFNTFQGLADKGTIMDPAYIDRAIQLTTGTPYQKGIALTAQQAQETGGVASQPIRNQQALLDGVDALIAKQGRSPALDKRREQIAKVLTGSQNDLKTDGLRAGLERGVLTELAPIDVSTLESFAGSVVKRLEQAQTVSLWAGKSVSPLDAREADQVRTMLDSLPAKQKSQAVATLAGAVGPRFSAAIAEQLDGQDRPLSLAFAHAGSQTTTDRYTSELLLKGATAIKDKSVMTDDKKVTGWKSTIAKQLEGVFGNEKEATDNKDSAYYIAAGIAAENGGNISPSEIERAVRLSVGGSIIERNNKRIPIPAGMDEDAFDKRLRSVSVGEITRQAPDGKVRVAGVEMSNEEFSKTIPGQELLYVEPGKYAVIVKGRSVRNSAGRPIIIGVQ